MLHFPGDNNGQEGDTPQCSLWTSLLITTLDPEQLSFNRTPSYPQNQSLPTHWSICYSLENSLGQLNAGGKSGLSTLLILVTVSSALLGNRWVEPGPPYSLPTPPPRTLSMEFKI